ncbi:MAG: N-acetylmuramoyl-L-alanine amidase [Candidatus Aminicenantes bacterium]|nr:N-acetylmuramoyl-L-alanine amidase [Candidatus Aminicenantes bacterium]
MNKIIKTSTIFIASLCFIQILPALSIDFRSSDHEEFTRIVFEADQKFTYSVRNLPGQLQIFVPQHARINSRSLAMQNSRLLDRITHESKEGKYIITVIFKTAVSVNKNFVLEKPFRVVFDLVKSEKQIPQPPSNPKSIETPQNDPPHQPSSEPVSSKVKPIETICIDPGHGGEDLGALGKSKLQEKDVTLQISLKLKKLIEAKTGLRVIMTRDSDKEVSLNSRASIANNQQAQIFVSIHVNSSFRKSAYGSETYFVSLQATDPEALELARKENQNPEDPGETIINDELKMILWNMAQTEYIRASSTLAEYIQKELNDLLNTRNRGVKQAPFRVLMRTAMPAVLVETVFISNPTEEKKLQKDEFLDKIALALFNGISKFIYYYNHIVT